MMLVQRLLSFSDYADVNYRGTANEQIENEDQFQQMMKNSYKEPQLLLFYADWCGHCTKLKPVWDTLVAQSNSKNLHKMNCSDRNSYANTKKDLFEGFPTICRMYEGQPKTFQGNRTEGELEKFRIQG